MYTIVVYRISPRNTCVAYVFLALNGYDLDAIEPDVVTTMEGVAASPVSEAVRTTWVRARLYRLSKWRYARIDEGPSPADQSMVEV